MSRAKAAGRTSAYGDQCINDRFSAQGSGCLRGREGLTPPTPRLQIAVTAVLYSVSRRHLTLPLRAPAARVSCSCTGPPSVGRCGFGPRTSSERREWLGHPLPPYPPTPFPWPCGGRAAGLPPPTPLPQIPRYHPTHLTNSRNLAASQRRQ